MMSDAALTRPFLTRALLPVMLTMGNGIGPEITAKWLASGPDLPRPLVVVGQADALAAMTYTPADTPSFTSVPHFTKVPLTGSPGDVAYQALVLAVEAIANGQAAGLLTGPISKQALWQAGHHYNGHTELLAELANQHWPQQTYAPEMLFVYERFRLLLLTRHVPLALVSQTLTIDSVTRALLTLVRFLQQQVGVAKPRLALLGVNPHAGEIGGTEESTVLLPARQAIIDQTGADITLPLAADGFFRGFTATNPEFDAVVAPYHDQGLIPFKLLAGWQAVNVTLGLPFIRTSVSHGTAPDIVGKGIATTASLQAAYTQLVEWLPPC
jgi:4-hydroxythreonine-4-phosphate dehydrogenase